MLYRGITRQYRQSKQLSWWTPAVEHAARYCHEEDGSSIIAIDDSALKIIECPEAIGDSWLADSGASGWAMGLLRELGADGFRRTDAAGIEVCLLPEAVAGKVDIYEQF